MVAITTRNKRTESSTEAFVKELALASNAACGAIYVKTREPMRAASSVFDWTISSGYTMNLWTSVTGWMKYPNRDDYDSAVRSGREVRLDLDCPASVNQAQREITQAFDVIFMTARNVAGSANTFHLATNAEEQRECFVMLYPGYAFENATVKQYIRQQAYDAMVAGKRLIIIESFATRIPSAVEDDLYIIEHKEPSFHELREMWDDTLDSYVTGAYAHFTDDDIGSIIQNALGMTSAEFSRTVAFAHVTITDRLLSAKRIANPKQKGTVLLLAEDYHSVTPDEYIRFMMKAKTEVLKRTDMLELLSPVDMDSVGGLDNLKQWLDLRKIAFTTQAAEYGVDIPKGFLVVGVPGSGKSLIAKATASVLDIPCIRFDIGKVFSRYVGDSEMQIRAALSLVEAMAPVVLFIDEVDKGFAGSSASGSTDGGTTSRVIGTFLTWLQERNSDEKPIFVIMTANDISGLPPELLRKGRLDEIFSVTFPSAEERKAILRIHFEKRGHTALPEAFYADVASVTSELVGAELESLVNETLLYCLTHGVEVSSEVFCKQREGLKPMSAAWASRIKAMDDWAKTNAKPASIVYNTPNSGDATTTTSQVRRLPSRGLKSRAISARDITN